MTRVTFADESPEYRKARDELLDAEIALRRQMESVAAQRRSLPPGPPIAHDYVFDGLGEDGKPAKIALSALFREGTDTLLLYCYMFPRFKDDPRAAAESGAIAKLPKAEQPCPSCTGLLDQLNGAAPHYEAGGCNFAVVGKTSLQNLLAVARDRNWRHLRMLSSGDNGFKHAYHAEADDGQQDPMTLVFKRDGDGTIRLFWTSELVHTESDPGQDHRAAGTIEPFWNMFDLGPGGRPDGFHEQLQYHCCSGARPHTASEKA